MPGGSENPVSGADVLGETLPRPSELPPPWRCRVFCRKRPVPESVLREGRRWFSRRYRRMITSVDQAFGPGGLVSACGIRTSGCERPQPSWSGTTIEALIKNWRAPVPCSVRGHRLHLCGDIVNALARPKEVLRRLLPCLGR